MRRLTLEPVDIVASPYGTCLSPLRTAIDLSARARHPWQIGAVDQLLRPDGPGPVPPAALEAYDADREPAPLHLFGPTAAAPPTGGPGYPPWTAPGAPAPSGPPRPGPAG